jgi:hypothetical protein
MKKYKIYNQYKSVIVEAPKLEDAIRFIKDNGVGQIYTLEFEGVELNVRLGNKFTTPLKSIVGGKL